MSLKYTDDPASVRRCPSTISKIFSSKTAWPIKAKFYVEPPWIGGTKVCSRHLGHMTKMAAKPRAATIHLSHDTIRIAIQSSQYDTYPDTFQKSQTKCLWCINTNSNIQCIKRLHDILL